MEIIPKREMTAHRKTSSFHMALALFVLAGFIAKAQTTTFAQLTDAHLFDAGQHRPAQGGFEDYLDNQSSLGWAVHEVNRLISSGQNIDFVAFTGDFGLENAKPDDAAREVAMFFRALLVKKVFLVPGNNDLRAEDPAELPNFQRFTGELTRLLPDHDIVDLTRKSETIKGIQIIGLNSATFKNGYGKLSEAHKRDQQNEFHRLEGEMTRPGPKIVFTHIPNLEDPYEPEAGKRRNAWNLDAGLAKQWTEMVNRDDVLGVFAGHFHDSRRNLYMQDYSWANNKPSLVEGKKTWVAPPLAVKFQAGVATQARGFLLATVSANGTVAATPKWFGYADTSPLPDKASALMQADAEAHHKDWDRALTFYGQALSSTDPAVYARAERGYLTARENVEARKVRKWIAWLAGGIALIALICLVISSVLRHKIPHGSVVIENCLKVTENAPVDLFGVALVAAALDIRDVYEKERERAKWGKRVNGEKPMAISSSTAKVFEDFLKSLPDVHGVKIGAIIGALPQLYRYFFRLRLESGLAIYDDGSGSVHATLRWRWTTIGAWVDSTQISSPNTSLEPLATSLTKVLAEQLASDILCSSPSSPDDSLIVDSRVLK